MGKKKKSQKKGKSSKKNKKHRSSAVLVLSVKTANGWQKLFSQKLTSKKPLSENVIDLYFDAKDTVRDEIKKGIGTFRKGLKVKTELIEQKKSSKKKCEKKNGKKKKSSKSKSSGSKKSVTNTKTKNKKSTTIKSASTSATKKKTVSTVKKKPVNKKGAPRGASLKKATAGAKRGPKPGTKRKTTLKRKTTVTAKKSTVVKRGRKPNPRKAGTDDLKKVMGIGAKMEKILHRKGIKTYAALSSVGVKKLQAIIDGAGGYYRSYKASMWKSEAALAKAGKFDKMKSGRR
jgi:predicted flap endonuclease-1-like 5' DNA nuclease